MLNRLVVLVAAAVILPLTACAQTGPATSGERATTVASSPAPPIVIAISMDGLNPTAIERLGDAVPHYRRLMREGSWTFNARAGQELTDTLPNHTGMMTGRPIRGTAGHRVTFNQDRPRSWLAKVAGRYVRGMFDVAHDRALSTALYTSKTKFDFLDRSWNGRHGAKDRTGADNGRDKIGTYVRAAPGTALDRLLSRLVRSPARMTFWHNSVPDAAGHAHGFMSPRYLQAVRRTDAMLGRLLRTLDPRPALKRRVSIVLTADHGGWGASHRDASKYQNYRIPFIVWGRGVARGSDLYALNRGSRRDPGRARVGYSGVQPVRNTDVANLAAWLVGAPRVVGFANRPTLKVR